VREEFWLEKLQGMKIKHPKTLFENIKNILSFKPEELVKNYEKSSRIKK